MVVVVLVVLAVVVAVVVVVIVEVVILVVEVVLVVVVVVVFYALQHAKLEISENFSTLPSRFFVGTDFIRNKLQGKAEAVYKLCTV